MIGTVGAIIASAVIGGGVALASGAMQAKSAEKAANTQKQVADENIAYQREVDAQKRADLEPWRQAGLKALDELQAGIADGSFDPSKFEFEKDPGYDFRLEQGQKALERSAAAHGNLFSGQLGEALTEYGQDYASNEYDRAYARAADAKRTNYNILAGIAGTGQQTVTAMNDDAQQGANIIIGQNTAGGNALAQGYLNQGNAWANAFGNTAAAANTGIENYLLYKYLGD
jgi:hypothetical protein